MKKRYVSDRRINYLTFYIIFKAILRLKHLLYLQYEFYYDQGCKGKVIMDTETVLKLYS